MDHEVTVPASSAGSVLRAPALRGMPRHEEVRSDQTTTGADQALDERRGDPERGFDTTLKGRRGRRRSDASARTTVTSR